MQKLVGAQEIAELLGVSRQRVHQLAGSGGFPEPVERLAQGSVWRLRDVELWRQQNRPVSNQLADDAPVVPPRDPDRPQDDPWDANAVRYLLDTPEGGSWSRGTLMECLRGQRNRVERQPERVSAAAELASRYGVERRADPGGKTIHFFRSDADAPATYPSSATERRAWLANESALPG